MDEFWKWLMRANARGVFLAAVLALLAVLAWWVWKEYAPPKEVAIPTSSKEPRRGHRGGLPVLQFMKEQLDLGQIRLASNPFLSPMRRNMYQPNLPEIAALTPRNPLENLVPRPSPSPAIPSRPPVAPPPKLPPRMAPPPPAPSAPPAAPPVTVTYRGMLQRPDGRVMALIEDSESGTSTFYDAERTLFGLRVTLVGRDEVTALTPKGRLVTLKMGQPVPVPGGAHAR
jgi:hypothetical protein